ncbi:TetR/AcrR family transcriptional regulator [Paenibacillus thiaminolyticus]|uniref:TetR/AcrR family transcriptional regulator n=1 Tax=Paenibacillus thiaminolyticus TaxID=49283 RepID=UPI002542C9E3|nr:TetR/AcrR family transcriptional regulator [Paenibacillus thiaminolyticus]WII39798.1 TetR/AcrR family transcriptional regulator [Paenibacillus thiaminolyticus]
MEDRSADKKKYILQSAMKLFATQGYVQTTMQEIAQYCKMSKGSVYQHYASKEELLLNIFKYYYRLLYDRMQIIERDPLLTPRERMKKKIEVHMVMWSEYPEFTTMQMRENAGFANKEIHQFLQQVSLDNTRSIMNDFTDMYGNAISPYKLDLTLQLHGIISTYLNVLLLEEVTVKLDRLSDYALDLVDLNAQKLLQSRPEPFMKEEDWPALLHAISQEPQKAMHPLVLVQKMREELSRQSLPPEQYQDATDSLAVLEQELMEIQPRRVIVLGMLANLKRLETLRPVCDQLETAVQHLKRL